LPSSPIFTTCSYSASRSLSKCGSYLIGPTRGTICSSSALRRSSGRGRTSYPSKASKSNTYSTAGVSTAARLTSSARDTLARFWSRWKLGRPASSGTTSSPSKLNPSYGTVGRGVAVFLLDQQPLFFTFLQLHERPFALELVAMQLEQQLALLHPLLGILERHPAPAVPYDHPAGAVVAFGDDSLELAVLERVVLYVDSESLVGAVGRGTLRDGPGPEHAIHLEAQVPVEPPG